MGAQDNSSYAVNQQGTQNPYKEFPITIAANGGIETLYYDYNFIRFLSATSVTGLTARFGQAGTETTVVGAGIGMKFDETLRNVYFKNTSGSAITILVAACIGDIRDDRLTVTGNLNVVSPAGTEILTTGAGTIFLSAPDVASTTLTTVLASAANANRKELFITNNGAVAIRCGDASTGAARGFSIPAGGTGIIATKAAVYVYNPGATSTVSIVENNI